MPTTEDPRRSPGYLVKRAREALYLTQDVFADKLDTSQQTVSRWESGHVRVPVKYVDRIARTLEMGEEGRYQLLDAIAYQAQNPTVEYGPDATTAMLASNQEQIVLVSAQVAELTSTVDKLIALLGERSNR